MKFYAAVKQNKVDLQLLIWKDLYDFSSEKQKQVQKQSTQKGNKQLQIKKKKRHAFAPNVKGDVHFHHFVHWRKKLPL